MDGLVLLPAISWIELAMLGQEPSTRYMYSVESPSPNASHT